MSTANLTLEYVTTNILTPDLPINESLMILDAFITKAVVDKDLNTPPTTTTSDAGKVWIIGPSPTGRWASKAGQLAIWTGANTEHYITPKEGWTFDVIDEDVKYRYSGSAWVSTAGTGSAGKHGIPIMASGMTPKISGGCAALAYLTGASNQPDVPYLAFDNTTGEAAVFAIPMPKSWNEGTVTFIPHWAHPATTTNFGVCWKLRAIAVSNDDAMAATYGTAQSSVDTGGTTSDYYAGPESSAITIGGTPAAQDMVFFEIARDPADGGDNLAVDAYLIGLTLFYTTDAETDA